MAKVFVLGATGIIGGAIAKAFQVKGYEVYGLTRTEQKAKELSKLEIHPVVGTVLDAAKWKDIAASCQIIIEAVSDHADQTTAPNLQKIIASIVKDTPKVVIYTSGVWVYGNTVDRVDENGPFNTPLLVSGRPALEKLYTDMGAIVLRPGCVYGAGGSLTAMWFKALKEGKGQFPGHPAHPPVIPTIHHADVATAYVLAVEKASQIRGQTFTLVSQTESVDNCLHAAAHAIGYKGEIKFVAPQDPFSECLSLDQSRLSTQKIRNVLGWKPQQESFITGVNKYYNSFLAHQ